MLKTLKARFNDIHVMFTCILTTKKIYIYSQWRGRSKLDVNLGEGQETGPPSSLALSPDHVFPKPNSERHPSASSDRAEDESSLGEMDIECAASERSSRDDRSYYELIEVITYSVQSSVRLATGTRDLIRLRISVGWPRGSPRETVPPLFSRSP